MTIKYMHVHFIVNRETKLIQKTSIENLERLMMHCFNAVTEKETAQIMIARHDLIEGKTVKVKITSLKNKRIWSHLLIKPICTTEV